MEDSSLFMQWAMNTLDQHQQQHPAAAGGARAYSDGDGGGGSEGAAAAAFPSLQALRSAGVRDLTVQVDHRASSSWSSGDSPGAAMDHDGAAVAAATTAGWSPHTARSRTAAGAGGSNRPMSWNFSAASAQPTDISLPAAAGRGHTPSGSGKRGGGAGPAAAAAPSPVQDHIIAERRRREKINQRFIELSTVIPGLKKMDKATILGDAVKYVRELQEKVKTMEEDESHHAASTIQSAVLVKRKPCLASSSGDGAAAADEPAPEISHGGLPEIEVRLSERSVLVRIHCENARGLLVRVLAEVEELRLAITHTSVMPFPAATAIITITAKVEEGFNSTVEEIVSRLNSVLHQHYRGSS